MVNKYIFGGSRLRKFTKEVKLRDEVWCIPMDCSMFVRNIRIDTLGRPIFDLETYYSPTAYYIASFEEILEIYLP